MRLPHPSLPAVPLVAATAIMAGQGGLSAPSAPPAAGSTVAVSLAAPVRSVTPALLGLNAVNTTGPRWDDPKLDAVLSKFGPGVLRYPGGTNANYWAWQSGWFQPGRWPSEPGISVDDEIGVFGAALKSAKATPIYDLNTVTYDGKIGSASANQAMLGGQLSFLHAAAADGLPVKMVELGNELYLTGAVNSGPHGDDYARRFPTAADYATQMNTWIAAIHSAFPGVKVAAVADDPNYIPGVSQRRQTWDASVLPKLHGEDAVTVHEIQRVYTTSPAAVLAQPYTRFRTFAANQLKLIESYHVPVWLTAFNMEDQTKGLALQGTWLHGLYVAEQALLFLGEPAFSYIGLSGSIGTAHGGAIFDGPHGLGSGKPPTVPLALTAAGSTLSLIQAAFRTAHSAQPLTFSPRPSLSGTSAPALLGEDARTTAGERLVLVNASAQPVTLNVSGIFPGRFTATEVSAPSVTTLITGPASVITKSTTGTGDVTVGPYTLAEISG